MIRRQIGAAVLFRRHSVWFPLVSLCVLLSPWTAVEAGVVAKVTESRNPPATPFTTDTAYNSAPLSDTWKSYVIGLATDDGSEISAVDVTISGALNQRWALIDDDGDPDTPSIQTPNPALTLGAANSLATADSHLLLPVNPITFSAPTENNNQPSGLPTAADTAARDYGIGTLLKGAWGFTASEQLTSVNVAYLVVPKSLDPFNYHLHVELATNPDQIPNPLVVLDSENGDDFCPGPFCRIIGEGIPVVGDLGPLVGDMSLNPPDTPTIVSGTLPATDDRPISELTWMFTGVNTGPAGGVLLAPTLDPATGLFTWDVNGSKGGLYTFQIKATDAGPGPSFSDSGILSVQVVVPEPATLANLGLALVGMLVGGRRRG